MKITIELDGKAVELTGVPTSGASTGAEPPAELVAAARALGAQSAGPAAFSLPPRASAPRSKIDVTEPAAQGDLDAGSAAQVTAGSALPAKEAGEFAAFK